MSFKNLLRYLVVRTNRYTPFRVFNRLAYFAAIKVFVSVYRKLPEVRSVYLRHGMTEGNWVPGLSDIDLTVITKSGLGLKDEFNFLESFWRTFSRLKKCFPMLGEVEILDEQLLSSWTQFRIHGYEVTNWKLILGKNTLKKNYLCDQTRIVNDSLNYALMQYPEFFLPKYYQTVQFASLQEEELRRVRNKILRYASSDIDEQNGQTERLAEDKLSILCSIVQGLEYGVERFVPQKIPLSLEKYAKNWFDCSKPNQKTVNKDEVEAFKEIIENPSIVGLYLSETANYVVLENNLDEPDMKATISQASNVLLSKQITPIYVSRNTFIYILRFSAPHQYIDLVANGKSVKGLDFLRSIEKPNLYFAVKALLEKTIRVHLFTGSEELFSSTSSNNSLEMKLLRAIFIKLLLEKQFIATLYHENVAEYQRAYPEILEKIIKLKNGSNIPSRMLRYEWFKLSKKMSRDVHSLIMKSSLLYNFFGINCQHFKKETQVSA